MTTTIVIREDHGRYWSTVHGVPGYSHVRRRAGLSAVECATHVMETLAGPDLAGITDTVIMAPEEVLAILPAHVRGREAAVAKSPDAPPTLLRPQAPILDPDTDEFRLLSATPHGAWLHVTAAVTGRPGAIHAHVDNRHTVRLLDRAWSIESDLDSLGFDDPLCDEALGLVGRWIDYVREISRGMPSRGET